MDINTCLATTSEYHTIAYYSHLIPIAIALILGVFMFVRSRRSLLSSIFLLFTVSFSLWLIGDVITWTTYDYDLVSFVWAPLDYINIIFYLLGAYFFAVLVMERDLTDWQKLILFTLTLPAFYVTATGTSISLFNQPWCEAFNSLFLTEYKLVLGGATILFIIILGTKAYRRGDAMKRRQIAIVGSALVLFFSIFSVTEYIASQTGIYEINLYSLFVLPIFLGLVIYAVTDLEIFRVRSFATQILIYSLLILIGSQLFFLESTTDKILTVITFILSLAFGALLMRGVHQELRNRQEIEDLAKKLEAANKNLTALDATKNEFLSFATHQLRSPLTSVKWGLGALKEKYDESTVDKLLTTTDDLISTVNDLLDISKIEQGGLVMKMEEFDLHDFVGRVVEEFRMTAEKKGLRLAYTGEIVPSFVMADQTKLRQVFVNLIDNAIKYTQKGDIKVVFRRIGKTAEVSVWDTGPGIAPEELKDLFDKFLRGAAGKASQGGSGLGLYLAKKIIENHHGRLSALSEGLGKGSVFTVTLPLKS